MYAREVIASDKSFQDRYRFRGITARFTRKGTLYRGKTDQMAASKVADSCRLKLQMVF